MSEIGKLFEATKPFRDEIDKLRAEVELHAAKADALREEARDANLQVRVFKTALEVIADPSRHWESKCGRDDTLGSQCNCSGVIANHVLESPTEDALRILATAECACYRYPGNNETFSDKCKKHSSNEGCSHKSLVNTSAREQQGLPATCAECGDLVQIH